jgi:hypothetical protein
MGEGLVIIELVHIEQPPKQAFVITLSVREALGLQNTLAAMGNDANHEFLSTLRKLLTDSIDHAVLPA